eukprot:SAG31_NODE_4249_length_3420_cov_1.934056_1_plen_624_part_00
MGYAYKDICYIASSARGGLLNLDNSRIATAAPPADRPHSLLDSAALQRGHASVSALVSAWRSRGGAAPAGGAARAAPACRPRSTIYISRGQAPTATMAAYSSESDDDDRDATIVVIDVGDFTVKAGMAGMEEPSCMFAPLVVPNGPTAAGEEPLNMERIREFYRDPQSALRQAAALICAHQLLSFAKLGDTRLSTLLHQPTASTLSQTVDWDVMMFVARARRQSAVAERLLLAGCYAGCNADGSRFISGKPCRVGDEVTSCGDRDRAETSARCYKWRCNNPNAHVWNLDWDALEIIWMHAFCEVGVNATAGSDDASEDQVFALVTEPLLSPKFVRERMTALMFDRFRVARFYLHPCQVLALYSTGRTTGVVLSCGFAFSHAYVCYEGYSLPHAAQTQMMGGRDVTAYMATFLSEAPTCVPSARDGEHAMDVARRTKEQHGYVALDIDAELSRVGPIRGSHARCPEVLFSPSVWLATEHHRGVGALVADAIVKSDVDIWNDLCRNIVLEGGSTLFSGFAERLKREVVVAMRLSLEEKAAKAEAYLKKLESKAMGPGDCDLSEQVARAARGAGHAVKAVQRAKNASYNVVASQQYSVWVGGSTLASSSMFDRMWVTREQYEETGS